MTDSITNSGEMLQTAANGGDNVPNGADVTRSQGGDDYAGKVRHVFGVDNPEWVNASEKDKREGARFLTTASIKALLGIDWNANGLPSAWAEALHQAGFIKAPSAMKQTREPMATPADGNRQKGYFAPPLRTAERDAELQRDAESLARDVARDAVVIGGDWRVPPDMAMALEERPKWLTDEVMRGAIEQPSVTRVGFVENLPSTFTGGGIRFVTGYLKDKGDDSGKMNKIPHGDGTVKNDKDKDSDGVYLRGIDELKELGEPGAFTVTVRGKDGRDVARTADFVGLHMYHTQDVRAVCLDIDGILAADDVIQDGAQLVAVVCSKLGDDDFRVQIIRQAVNAGHWVERSVSQRGIHIWLLGVSRVGTKRGSLPIEVYDHSFAAKSDSAVGFIALGKRVLVARGVVDECGDGVEPADSLEDGQGIIDAVVQHYWAKEIERDAKVGGVVDGEVIGGAGGMSLPPDASYHAIQAKGLAADKTLGMPPTGSTRDAIKQMERHKVASSGELGSQIQRFIDMRLDGRESVDALRLIDWVNAQAKTAAAAISGVNAGVAHDSHWHTVKTWALLQGAVQEPWLLGDYLRKFPNKADGTPLGWQKANGEADRSQLMWSLYLDLLKLMQPSDDDARRYAVKVIAHAVEASGAWGWALNRRNSDEGAARQLVQNDVMKASSVYLQYVKEVEARKAAEAAASAMRSQGGDELLTALKAKAREPWCTAMYRRNIEDFSYPLSAESANWFHWSMGKKPAPLCTPENVGLLLMLYGLRVRFNDMRHAPEYEGFGVDAGDHEAALNRVYALATMNGLRWNIDDVDRMFTQWAQNNRFHPAREWIEGKRWDGVSRIDAFADTVTVQEGQRDNWLMYFRRWALGAIHALYSFTGGASKHMLVLQGTQSAGKTRWFRTLMGAQPIGKDGVMLDVKNKDSVAETLTWWLVELGELEATYTTKQLAELKAFTSKVTDEWRSPYGRKVNVYPRRTAFVGTVNDDNPLADRTGNTRFATVTAESINPQHGVDVQQMWAEVLHIFGTGTAEEKRHWLTKEEEAAMEVQNEQYVADSGYKAVLEGMFDWSDEGLAAMRVSVDKSENAAFAHSATVWKAMGFTTERPPNERQQKDIALALKALGAIQSKNAVRKDGKQGRGFYLPKFLGDVMHRGSDGYLK